MQYALIFFDVQLILAQMGSRREGQCHARCIRGGADVTRAMEGKHEGHVQYVWGPSLHGNRADTAVSAMTAVRSTARKHHDHDYSSPHAESRRLVRRY